jgi:FkbM family methyltransferase
MLMNPAVERIAADFAAWQNAAAPERTTLIASVLSGSRACYVMGRNANSRFIAARLALAGVVDDAAAPAGERWGDLPVVRGDDVPAQACVISAVLHRRPHQARARIRAMAGAPLAFDYADLTRHDPVRFSPLPFSAAARSAFFGHLDAFAGVASRLLDDRSRDVLHDVLLYRLSADPEFTAGYALRDPEQYFDVGLEFADPPRFVDGGAFQGETTQEFLRRYPRNAGSLLFEPNPDSLARARARLAGHNAIEYHPMALGDRVETTFFDDSAANASKITAHGALCVEVTPLDRIVDAPVHFIKYDLEGYETRAIDGARETIARHHPALAICVYHDIMDFIDVPRHVRSIRDDYDLLLRHYTEGWEETVMYFVPRA